TFDPAAFSWVGAMIRGAGPFNTQQDVPALLAYRTPEPVPAEVPSVADAATQGQGSASGIPLPGGVRKVEGGVEVHGVGLSGHGVAVFSQETGARYTGVPGRLSVSINPDPRSAGADSRRLLINPPDSGPSESSRPSACQPWQPFQALALR